MAFSLTYAFGAMGRHTRKISREARAFIGAKFRNLEPSRFRDYLFAQYYAIDGTLFSVFYNDDPNHPLYSIHKKYATKLLDATESGRFEATYHTSDYGYSGWERGTRRLQSAELETFRRWQLNISPAR